MSSVSSVPPPAAVPPVQQSTPSTAKRAPDGDTQAQEAAETNAAKRAEKLNGGFAPKSGVNKIA